MSDRYVLDFTKTLDGGKAAVITDTVTQCGMYLYSDRDSLTFGLVEQQAARIAELEAERDQLRAEVERLTLSAARYEALRARHAYLIVSRLMGRESFSSETSRAQIDGFADKARAEVDAFNALTPEQRMNELQAHVDTARKATP